MKSALLIMILTAAACYGGILDWGAFEGGPIEDYRITWNVGYDSILRQNVGFGLMAINFFGELEAEYGYLLDARFGENGFCLNLQYAGTLVNLDKAELFQSLYMMGAGFGISYIYNKTDGTVYETPVRGIGFSGRLALASIVLSLGIYKDLEHTDRSYFYTAGLSFGF